MIVFAKLDTVAHLYLLPLLVNAVVYLEVHWLPCRSLLINQPKLTEDGLCTREERERKASLHNVRLRLSVVLRFNTVRKVLRSSTNTTHRFPDRHPHLILHLLLQRFLLRLHSLVLGLQSDSLVKGFQVDRLHM